MDKYERRNTVMPAYLLLALLAVLTGCSSAYNGMRQPEAFTGYIVDIENRQTYPGTIVCDKGRITEIRREKSVPDGSLYYLPGMTDAHIHIESSMMTPANFSKIAVTHGVVSSVSDPHEIVNVLGIKGLDFMSENGSMSRFRFYWGLPSCVPSSGLESAGAVIDAEMTAGLMRREDVWYLAEMMNYPGVISGDTEVMEKIAAAKEAGKPVDGHAPGVMGDDLVRYASAGISTDHECSTAEEARQRIGLGMKVIVREGSAARNFDALATVIAEHPESCMLCSDDKHPDDLVEGHIDDMVRRGLTKGIPIWSLLRAAVINPVEHYGMDTGLMRAGDNATFIAVDNLADFNVRQTVIDGFVVYDAAADGLDERALMVGQPSQETPNNFNAARITPADIALTVPPEGKARVIVAYDGELRTGHETVPVGQLSDGSIQKIVVYNRYGNGTPQTGFIKGFGITDGAIGASIAHDSHNIVAIGSDDAEITKVINAIIDTKGGVAVSDRSGVELLPLPIAGILSDKPAEEISAKYRVLDAKAKEMGCRLKAPFITMAFMALPVIPSLKLTDKGLVDVDRFDFTDIFF